MTLQKGLKGHVRNRVNPGGPVGKRFRAALAIAFAAIAAGIVFLLYQLMTPPDAYFPRDGDPTGANARVHGSVSDPASMGGDDAERIYQAIQPRLAEGYFRSGDPIALAYGNWTRHNTVPYRSSRHGNLFVNNYANAKAENYGLFERSGPVRTGAIIVKDSFIVTESGDIMSGPMFLMEKMTPGYAPEYSDWLYMTIAPDGIVTGISRDASSADMRYCGRCHNGAPSGFGLFFLPENVRPDRAGFGRIPNATGK
jgi:hypothetical protein